MTTTVFAPDPWFLGAASCMDIQGVFIPVTIQCADEQVRAWLLLRTQTAVDRVGRRFTRGRGYRELIRASLVHSLAEAGLMFTDDVLDRITDTIMAGRRVDAATVIPWRPAPANGASAAAHPCNGRRP